MYKCGDEEIVEVLGAWLRACLVGAYDIQRFLEVVGPGKTGTSLHLRHSVLHSSALKTQSLLTLKIFAVVLNLHDSLTQVCLFNGVERYAGDVSKFKAMTGGDPLRAEHKKLLVPKSHPSSSKTLYGHR